jgi:zinc transporter ZupT
MLVLGFMLHNVTEGLAIVAPLARTRAGIAKLLMLGAIGGLPTIVGAWIGGFTYSPVWALLFLAIGAGAIFQVAWQIMTQIAAQRQRGTALLDFTNVSGLLAGFLIMYITGLFVAA